MSFADDLLRFSRRTSINLDTVCRKVTIDMGTEIVKRTPVDTGLARNSFFIGYSRVGTVGGAADRTGSGSLTRIVEFSRGLKAGDIWFITNNLPYIMPLEYGHSKIQAPSGMVRITVSKWQNTVARIVRSLR